MVRAYEVCATLRPCRRKRMLREKNEKYKLPTARTRYVYHDSGPSSDAVAESQSRPDRSTDGCHGKTACQGKPKALILPRYSSSLQKPGVAS